MTGDFRLCGYIFAPREFWWAYYKTCSSIHEAVSEGCSNFGNASPDNAAAAVDGNRSQFCHRRRISLIGTLLLES
jgi:hypothetical protein